MKDKWLDDIRDKMSEFETGEPDGLWAEIESRQQIYPAGGRRRMWLRLRPWAVAASLAAVLALSCLYLFRGGAEIDMSGGIIVADTPAQPFAGNNKEVGTESVEAGNTPSLPATVASMKNRAPAVRAFNSHASKSIARSAGSGGETAEEAAPASSAVTDVNTTAETAAKDVEEAQETKEAQESSTRRSARTSASAGTACDESDYDYISPRSSRRRGGRLSVGLYTSGAGGNNSSSSSAHNSFYLDATEWNDKDKDDEVPVVRSRAAYEDKNLDMQHHLPLRFGVSVRYDITPRLGVETGLTYSRLSSDVKSSGAIDSYSGEQVLHYIGVPVNVKYRLASWKSFDFYASAGVMGEKCVSGELSGHNSGSQGQRNTVKLHEKRLQWSANASGGVEFDIVRNIGIYAEPGISYYFDNGSSIRNIYKDRQLNFNLNLGLRFSFGQ